MEVQGKIEELIALRASQWLERLPSASESEREEFVRWLEESRANVQAFLEIAEIELGLHEIDRERREDVYALVERMTGNVIPLGNQLPRSQIRGRRKIFAAAAACIAIVAFAGILYFKQFNAPQFSTSIGEQKTVELEDRSVVTLNAVSKIKVDMGVTERVVELREGEAIFTVAHDPKRPFRVYTKAAQVEAVGTEFNVYAKSDGTTRVSVLEGRVRLLPRSGHESNVAPLLLRAGEEAQIAADGAMLRHPNAVVANAVAWRQRRLVFNDAWLEDMVVEFNRHNRNVLLRLENVPSQSYQYDGVFDAADPRSFVDLLSKEPDLLVTQEGSEWVVRRKARSDTH